MKFGFDWDLKMDGSWMDNEWLTESVYTISSGELKTKTKIHSLVTL